MGAINSPELNPLAPASYANFQGINTTRDKSSLDTGDQQFLLTLENGYANSQGVILRDRTLVARKDVPQNQPIIHMNFFGRNLMAWAHREAGGISLRAEPNLSAPLAFTPGSVVTSTVFNNQIRFFSQGQQMWDCSGSVFVRASNTKEKPAFGVACQQRLCVAGYADRPTVVELSRVNFPNIYSSDELKTDTTATRAIDIDIRNLIGTTDFITGLGVFEKSRLAVFTNDQCLIYNISPDFTKIAFDDKGALSNGTISHNSIVSVGTDLIFADRSGIRSVRRSESNGVTIYSVPLSEIVEEKYRDLYFRTPNKQSISGFYDHDYGQYHLFFPISDYNTERLTVSIASAGSGVINKWSTGHYLNQRCGASFGGVTCIGTSGGIYEYVPSEDKTATPDFIPDLTLITPILWHGDITETKQARKFILQASGTGHIDIEAFNNEGQLLDAFKIDLDRPAEDDNGTHTIPLSEQYDRPFNFQYKGVQFKMTASGGSGRIKIMGFAVLIEGKEPSKRSRK